MPWSAKAKALITEQYAPTGAAARIGFDLVRDAFARASARGVPIDDTAIKASASRAADYAAVIRRYAWPVEEIDDLKIAPFHLLASEGHVHADKPQAWHMDHLAKLATADPLFRATATLMVDPDAPEDVERAVDWWLDLTGRGGEGMVLKPAEALLVRKDRGFLQPAIKCRGRNYLRIIYGIDYDAPQNLQRLRKRGLGAKRSLAYREFLLGLESLERFVAGEPLRRIHECVFAILALESEPVDPRL